MIIVCDNYRKDVLLKENRNKLINIKYMTKKEFIHKFYFDYDKEAIYELCKYLNCTYDIALMYLDNIYYIEDKKYNNDKLDKLVSVKKYLMDNNLLKVDNLFRNYLKNNDVIFDSLDLSKFDNIMITELKSITNVTIKSKIYNNYVPKIIELNTIDEEVEYVCIKICELISDGVNINNIKIAGINDDYTNSINRIFNMYNLRIDKKINLYSCGTVRAFIDNYNSDINKTIKILKDNNYDSDIIDNIIDIVNSYNFVSDYNLVKDLIISELKELEITIKYDNSIEIIDISKFDIKDEYVFYLNYNLESIPKVHLDDYYINNDIRYLTKLDSIENLNKKERISIKRNLENIKNLTITYKLKSPFSSFTKANIFNISEIKVDLPTKYNYSTISNKINLTKMYDDIIKYGKVNKNLSLFSDHYKIDYNSYDNKYIKINTNDLYEYLDNKIVLSYTSMNDYYKCSFKYYLKYILKIDKYKDNITRYIGSIFHYVLEQGLNHNIDINDTINKYLFDNNIVLNKKEEFFLNKLKEELPFVIATIKKQDNYILLKQRLCEEKIELEYKDKISVTFMGIIDKIIYDNDIYALIDYKTGSSSIDLSLNHYGINMQLAVYLFLASKKFKKAKFAGFYLQTILNKIGKTEDISKKESKLKLVGYSNNKYISQFDKTHKDSSLIKSLKVKNDDSYYSTSKVLSEDEFNDLINLAERKILECISDIVSARFDINPKNIDSKNVGCEFCIYKDICFMKNDDIVYLKKIEGV